MACVIDIYNQLLQNLTYIIQGFHLIYRYVNRKGENISITFALSDNEIIKPGQSPSLPATPVACCAQRDLNFSCIFAFKLQFTVTLNNACWKECDNFNPDQSTFSFEMPLPTRSILDPTIYMTDREKWDNGLDHNALGADIILAGVQFLVPGIYSKPTNKLITVVATKQKYHQIIRSELMRQDNIFFGNTYYSVLATVQASPHDFVDLVLQFKQEHDIKYLKADPDNPNYVCISLLFYAYGAQSDEDIIEYCNPQHDPEFTRFLINVFINGTFHKQQMYEKRKHTQVEAIFKMAQILLHPTFYQDMSADLQKYIHKISPTESAQYLVELGQNVRENYSVYMDHSKAFDKDDLANRRIETVAPQLLAELRSKLGEQFKQAFDKQKDSLEIYTFEQLKQNMSATCSTLNTVAFDLSKGLNKSLQKSFTTNSPNSQVYLKKMINEDKAYAQDFTQKREVIIRPYGNSRVIYNQCKVILENQGALCSIQTPEGGDKVGRYQSPPVYNYNTIAVDDARVKHYIQHHPSYLVKYQPHCMTVKVNSKIIGFVLIQQYKQLYHDLMEWRKVNAFKTTYSQFKPYYSEITEHQDQLFLSIFYSSERKELCVLTDALRPMWPIMKHKMKEGETLRDMINTGSLQYICKEMQSNFVLTEYQNFKDDVWSYLPYGMVAAFPATNPFVNCDKAVRAAYASSQWRQPIVQPYTNHMCLCTNEQLYMHEMQHSPIDTAISRSLFSKQPTTQLVYMGLMDFTYSQEDSLIANEGMFYRGGFASSSYKVFQSVCQKASYQFRVLDEHKGFTKNKLVNNKEAIPIEIGLTVDYGDVLIAKTQKMGTLEIDEYSTTYDIKHERKYSVVSNVNTSSFESQEKKMTRVQNARYPMEGDKYITRNAQKGTIGKIYREHDMPMLRNGITLSYISSYPSIIKRETYGQLKEILLNRWLVENKQYTINVGIDEPLPEHIQSQLCNVKMTPLLGFENPITSGQISMAAVVQLVLKKIRACEYGEIDKVNRQPRSGKNGALKSGNQEQIALMASGMSHLIIDQAGRNSSNTQWYWCEKCGGDQVYCKQPAKTFTCAKCGMLDMCDVNVGGLNFSEVIESNTLWSVGVGLKFVKEDTRRFMHVHKGEFVM